MHFYHVLFPLLLSLGTCIPTKHVNRTTTAAAGELSLSLSLARGIVQRAQAESAKLNGVRMDKPAHNTYWAGRKGWVSPPPLLEITPEISRAATVVSDAEGALLLHVAPGGANNATTTTLAVEKRAGGGGFWMGTLTRKGTVPWGDDPNYKA